MPGHDHLRFNLKYFGNLIIVLFILLGLLIAEQLLAYSASYHTKKGRRQEAMGGRWLRPVGNRQEGAKT